MNMAICLLLLSVFALTIAATQGSSNGEGNSFEKADNDLCLPLLFLMSGASSPVHSAAALMIVCGASIGCGGL